MSPTDVTNVGKACEVRRTLGNTWTLLMKDIYWWGETFWKQLQSEDDFCDVALTCDDGRIWAHRFIISSM